MQAALRPYATAGVALVGASVIAVSPVTVTPTAIQEVQDKAVQLSALVNPIDLFGPIFESAFENAQALGVQFAENPAPILQQILVNQINGIGNIGSALEAQVGVIPELPALLGDAIENGFANFGALAEFVPTLLEDIVGTLTSEQFQAQLQGVLDTAAAGDFGGAFTQLFGALLGSVGLPAAGILPLVSTALQGSLADAATLFPIAAGPLANAQAAVEAAQTPLLLVGLGALVPVFGTGVAAGDTLSGLLDAVQNGDPEAAFNAIVNGAAAATTAVLEGAVGPSGIAAGLQGLREAIAEAITNPSFPPPAEPADSVSKVPSAAAQSFTLTAPLKELAPSPRAGAASGEEKTGSGAVDVGTVDPTSGAKDTAGEATPTKTTDILKGGNLFVPGSTTTKGGRHRADTGNFAQGLRDAAEKTIKGLTGLGREKKSESSSATSASSESSSSSSGSGDSGSGGGEGSE